MTRYPVIPVRDIVLFPGVTMPLFIKRPRTLAAVAAAGDGLVLLVAQRQGAAETPTASDLYGIGTVARLRQTTVLSEGAHKLLVSGDRLAGIPVERLTAARRVQA